MSTSHPWKKVLYLYQPYPDNYVPHNFLHLLRTNEGVQIPLYWDLTLLSLRVALHVLITTTFLGIFFALFTQLVSPESILVLSVTSVSLFFPILAFCGIWPSLPSIRINVKIGVLFFLTLLVLSPIFSTLTADFSTDSIWALSCICLALNLLLTDYRIYHSVSFKGSAAIAINLAVFASVLLASRLPSTDAAFTLMLVSTEFFVLIPLLHRNLAKDFPPLTYILAITLAIIGLSLWYFISIKVVVSVFMVTILITIICPIWLKWLYRYKSTIHGPWDQADIQDTLNENNYQNITAK